MAVRRDLNGKLYTRPAPPQVWYLVDRGLKRGFTSGDVFHRLCVDVGQLIVSTEVEGIDDGPPWPDDVELIGSFEDPTIFVREGSVLRPIPSGEVMDTYHFNRNAVRLIHLAEVLTHPGGDRFEGPLTILPKSFDHSDDFTDETILLLNHHKITTWITVKIDGADGRVDGKTRIDNVHSEIGWTGGVEIILADVWSQPIFHRPPNPDTHFPGGHYSPGWTVDPGSTLEKTWQATYPGLGHRFADLGNVTLSHWNGTNDDPFDP
jgi:hypothetical protein